MAKQTFTTGQVLTAAQVNALQTNDFNQTVSAKTASYVLVAADKGTRIEFNTSGSVTCTVNTGLFDAGDTVYIQNTGAGVVTITAGTATVNTSATLGINQYEGGVLYFVSTSSAIWFEYASTATGDITGITTGATSGLTGGVTSGTADLKFNTTAKGGLLVGTGSGTVSELAVGSNTQVLTADSSTATGLKWAAAGSAGAMTLISRQNFSNVASISFSDVFTTTYENYLFCFTNVSAATVADDFQCVFIKSGGTDQTTGYYGSSILHAFNAQTFTWTQSSNASEFTMFAFTEQTVGYMFVTGSGAGQSGRLGINGSLTSLNSGYGTEIDAFNTSTQTYTGIKFKSSSTNITGTITLYGLAKA